MSGSTDSKQPIARADVSGSQGVQVGDNNKQANTYLTYIENPVIQVAPSAQIIPGIRTHAEEVAGLSGLRRNLTGEFLPFVPPDGQDETHPDQLFRQLAGMDRPGGVLLVGAAGAGKTRTCFEVGDRAVAHGWAVLHVKPGEPLVTTDQLADAIGAAGDRVLVIIDYLNECQGLDLVALRQRVLPDARRSGTQIVLLACARPGWQLQTSAELAPLFKLIRLNPDIDQSTRIRDQIVDALAPNARAILGRDRLLDLCGLRPVIAMLIALEAEAQANLGRLEAIPRGVRPEELIGWLHRRLREDGLLPEPSAHLLAEAEPTLSVQAITAMLTGGPQERETLISCGSSVLGGDSELAEHYLGIVIAMGWMTSQSNGLVAVHDIVTDQFLERTLLRPVSWTVRTAVADRFLTACLGRARTIGRYATNLGRMIRDLDLDGHGESLKAYCTNWLADKANHAGRALEEQQDEGAFALGAVIDSPCWSSVAFANWQSLVAPWLLRYGRTISARHVLYKGLRLVDAVQTGDLIPEATQWLAGHGSTLEASYVLAPLLARADLGEHAAQAVEQALAWLPVHGAAIDAEFVLTPLLARGDLGERGTQAVEQALAWLDVHGGALDAEFVLHSLLARTDLGERGSRAVAQASDWLDIHGAAIDAGFVLAPLLARGDLGERRVRAVERALAWLDVHGTARDAQYVLHSLLARTDLGERGTRAVEQAVTWLEIHGAALDAQFVLHSLLARADLGERGTLAVEQAVAWLDVHGAALDAQYVLAPLLERADLGDRGARAVEQAQAWLSGYGALLDAGFVLAPLLARGDLGERGARAVEQAQAWLSFHGTTPAAGFVLPPLVARLPIGKLDTEFLEDVDRWVALNPADTGIGFIAKYLARRGVMTERIATGVVKMVTANPGDEEAVWHLSPVARVLDRYPSLAAEVISAIEMHLRVLPPGMTGVNNRSQFDGMLEQLARRVSCRSGIIAARLDDIIDTWLSRPESLTNTTAQGSYFTALLARILSLTYSGRFCRADQAVLLKRIRVWVGHWKCGQHEETRALAFALTAQAEALSYRNFPMPPATSIDAPAM